MRSSVCLVNGETMPGERILGHGVIVVRTMGHQEETPETTVGVVRPGVTAHGIVMIIKMIVHVAPKWIENETMTRGGPLVLARVVHISGGRDHLTIIVKITIIRSANVEEWKHESALFAFRLRYVYRAV